MTFRNRYDTRTTLSKDVETLNDNDREQDGEQVLSESCQITSDSSSISKSPPPSTTVPTSTPPSTLNAPSAAVPPTPALPSPTQGRLRRFLSRLPRSPLPPFINRLVIIYAVLNLIAFGVGYYLNRPTMKRIKPGLPVPFQSDRFKTPEDLEFLGQRLGLIRESTNKTENIFCEPTEIMDDNSLKELFPDIELKDITRRRHVEIQFRDPELRGHIRVVTSSRVKVPTLRVIEARMSSRLLKSQNLGPEVDSLVTEGSVEKKSPRVSETLPYKLVAPLGLREVKIDHTSPRSNNEILSPITYVTVGFKDSLRPEVEIDWPHLEPILGASRPEDYYRVARHHKIDNKEKSSREGKETLSSLEIREECGFLKMEFVLPSDTGFLWNLYVSGPVLDIEIDEEKEDHPISSNNQQTESKGQEEQSPPTGLTLYSIHLLSLFGDIQVNSITSFHEINAATAVGNIVLNNLSLKASDLGTSFTISAKTQQGNVIVDIPQAPPVRPSSSIRPLKWNERPQSSRTNFELKATSELGQVLATVPSMLWGNTSVTAPFSTVHVVQPPLKKKPKFGQLDSNRDNHHDIDPDYNSKQQLSVVVKVWHWFRCTFSFFTYSYQPNLKCVKFGKHMRTAIVRNQKTRFVQMQKPSLPDSINGHSTRHSVSIQSRRKSKDGRPSAVLVSLDDREVDDNN